MKRKLISILMMGMVLLSSCQGSGVFAAENTENTESTAAASQVSESDDSETEKETENTEALVSEGAETEKNAELSNTEKTNTEDSGSQNQDDMDFWSILHSVTGNWTEEESENSESDSTVQDLQKDINGLPTTEEYAALSVADQTVIDAEVDDLKADYYDDLTNKERSQVDMSQMAALDIYADTFVYFGPDSEIDGEESRERNIVVLSDAELEELQDEINALPDLAEITNVSSILTDPETGAETGSVLAYSDPDVEMYISEKEVDELYMDVYDAASKYFQLDADQLKKISGGEKVVNLSGFFSVGLTAYTSGEETEELSDRGIGSALSSLLTNVFLEKVYAASSTSVGTISGYDKIRYTGSLSSSNWTAGYYEVTTNNTGSGGSLAFCANAMLDTPGGEGTTLTTQTVGASDKVKAILYYGYGGPGQLSTVANNDNGYLETHFAISWAINGSQGNVDLVSSNSYDKIYGNLTTAQKELAASCTDYWMVGTGVSGTQKLVYARFYAPLQLAKKGTTSQNVIAGATYYVYSDSACTTLCKDKNGKYALTSADGGKSNVLYYPIGKALYIKEYSAAPGTKKDTTVYPVTVTAGVTNWCNGWNSKKTSADGTYGWNFDEEYWRFGIIKKDAKTGELVADAVYRIYTDEDCTVSAGVNIKTLDTVKTTANAYTYNQEDEYFTAYWLTPGVTYYVKEYSSPEEYQLDETVYTLTARKTGTASEGYSYYIKIRDVETLVYQAGEEKAQTAILEVEDQPDDQPGYLKVKKVSGDESVTADNDMYSLAGAEYEVYASKEDAQNQENSLGTLVTDENGESNELELEAGEEGTDYFIRETKASAGYKICDGSMDDSDNGIHQVSVKEGETAEFICREPLVSTGISMFLNKCDEENTLQEAQGTASLEGAIFALEYWNNGTGDETGGPDKTWYYRTDAAGKIDFSDEAYVVGTYTFGEKQSQTDYAGKTISSDALTFDTEGNMVWSLGTYHIREICPPELYQLKGHIAIAGTDTEDWTDVKEGVQLKVIQNQETGEIEFFGNSEKLDPAEIDVCAYDFVHLSTVTVTKYGKSSKPLAGVTYKLVRLADGKAYNEVTTRADGTAIWEDLIPGEYVLTEIGTVDGYELLAESIHLTLPCQMTEEEIQANNADISKAYYDEATQTYCFENVNYDITDGVTFVVPSTGGFDKDWYLRIVLVFGMILAGGLLILRKKAVR